MNAAVDASIPFAGRRARRSLFAMGLTLLLASACGADNGEAAPDPVCGDGEVNGNDQCDGDDLGGATCESLGFAEGTVSCSSECTIDTTACIPVDADGDGIDYQTEQELGLDPNSPDTDTDGFFDKHELDTGSDPLSIASWPYDSGLFPYRLDYAQADGVTGAGWSVGMVAPNHVVTDQYGAQLQLHQFYGYKIVLSFGARWCNPCKQAAKDSEANIWSELKSQGYMVVEVLIESSNPGTPSTQDDVGFWAGLYGLSYPVTFGAAPPGTASIPTYYFINSDLTIAKKTEGWPGDAAVKSSALALY